MKRKYDNVFQFKITLNGIRPPIWRRIQVPETYTFWELHVAIQDAMGWSDTHLHHFEVIHPLYQKSEIIGIPTDDDWGDIDIKPGWNHKISQYFTGTTKKAQYIYDYGDNWEHTVLLEKTLLRLSGVDYPICLTGKCACPPEDCGGNLGYEEFLNIISHPNHEQHKEMLTWVGGDFDPQHFDINEVVFDDPAERKKIALG